MSSTEFASTITAGCETTFPNQFVTVFSATSPPCHSRTAKPYRARSTRNSLFAKFSKGPEDSLKPQAPGSGSRGSNATTHTPADIATRRPPFRDPQQSLWRGMQFNKLIR
jgi:hypothetical protein